MGRKYVFIAVIVGALVAVIVPLTKKTTECANQVEIDAFNTIVEACAGDADCEALVGDAPACEEAVEEVEEEAAVCSNQADIDTYNTAVTECEDDQACLDALTAVECVEEVASVCTNQAEIDEYNEALRNCNSDGCLNELTENIVECIQE